MKNIERAALVAATGVLAVGMTGCGKEPLKNEPKAETTTKDETTTESEEVSWTEADLNDVVAGMGDIKVVEGAQDPNLLHGITYDGDIVEAIEAESNADLETPGTYQVTYKVTVNAEKLAEYLTVDTASTEPVVKEEEAGDPEADKNAEPAEGDVDSAYTVDDNPVISVDKEVTVVGKDEATDLADQDEIIISDGNSTVTKSDGSSVAETPEIPKSTETTGSAVIDAATKEEVTSGSVEEDTETTEDEAEADTEDKDSKTDTKKETKKETKTDSKESNADTKTEAKKESKKDTTTVKATEAPASTKPSTSTPAASKPSVKPTEAPKQEAAHTHTWIQQYKTETVPAKTHVVHHDAEYKTVHHDAVTHEEPITEGHFVCTSCGLDMGRSQTALENHMDETGHGYSIEMVQVGTKTVTDQAAYDEQVQTKAAYDETVVDSPETTKQVPNGYKCSGCGATKQERKGSRRESGFFLVYCKKRDLCIL